MGVNSFILMTVFGFHQDTRIRAICCEFSATNNEEEYEALLAGLELCLDLGARHVHAKVDSQLIVNQINGFFTAKDPKMIGYLDFTKQITQRFVTFTIEQIPREQNTQGDNLAGRGSNFNPSALNSIPIIHLLQPAIQKPENVQTIYTVEEDSWTKPYYDWLQDGKFPDGRL